MTVSLFAMHHLNAKTRSNQINTSTEMKKMINLKSHLAIIFMLSSINLNAQVEKDYKNSLVNFEDYELIINEVKKVRYEKLISFDQLLEFQKKSNTVILDTRSKDKYEAKHLAGE